MDILWVILLAFVLLTGDKPAAIGIGDQDHVHHFTLAVARSRHRSTAEIDLAQGLLEPVAFGPSNGNDTEVALQLTDKLTGKPSSEAPDLLEQKSS